MDIHRRTQKVVFQNRNLSSVNVVAFASSCVQFEAIWYSRPSYWSHFPVQGAKTDESGLDSLLLLYGIPFPLYSRKTATWMTLLRATYIWSVEYDCISCPGSWIVTISAVALPMEHRPTNWIIWLLWWNTPYKGGATRSSKTHRFCDIGECAGCVSDDDDDRVLAEPHVGYDSRFHAVIIPHNQPIVPFPRYTLRSYWNRKTCQISMRNCWLLPPAWMLIVAVSLLPMK